MHQWAIRNGEKQFGATLHVMEAGIDTGAIVAQCHFDLLPKDTGLTLYKKTFDAGVEMTKGVIDEILSGTALSKTPQDTSRRHYYRHRDALNGEIDWSQTAEQVFNFIRAGNYEPFTSPTYSATWTLDHGEAITVLAAQSGPATSEVAGHLITLDESGPTIACGAGGSIQITRAKQGTNVINTKLWQNLFKNQK